MAKTMTKNKPAQTKTSRSKTTTPSPKRVVVEVVKPQINDGAVPIKRVVGEKVVVQAHIYADGHEAVAARLLYRKEGEKVWHPAPMTGLGNDVWQAEFRIDEMRPYFYTVQAWPDCVQTWQDDLSKKHAAGQDVGVDVRVGIGMLTRRLKKAEAGLAQALKEWIARLSEGEGAQRIAWALHSELPGLLRLFPDEREVTDYDKELEVRVDRAKALFSTWYEFFPRSTGPGTTHGTFKDCEARLLDIARQGFDVVYLPSIHPIGTTNRKGRNNALACTPDDPGSPWAIGSEIGGHKVLHPKLGTLADFKRFLKKAKDLGLEVALDIAFQCSPDHPYVKQHPAWFHWRPDGISSPLTLRHRTGRRCGRSSRASLSIGSSRACASSAWTIPTPSPSRSGRG